MKKHHPENERMKRAYFAYLEEARRMSPQSVDQVAAAIAGFEVSTGQKCFRTFHVEQARAFKRKLLEATNPETGKPLAKATIHARLMTLKNFFQWLAGRPGYRRITYSDAEYFNPSANDSRVATARRERPIPSIEQIRHVLSCMPYATAIEKRDRALVAFTLISGARDNAIASLSLKHVDPLTRSVFQDARDVRTKNRKTFTSWFFPVGNDLEAIVTDWIAYLTGELLFGPADPLFPATLVSLSEDGAFKATGIERRHWKTAAPVRQIFRDAFTRAGLPYFNPHSFRHTLAMLGEQLCTTPETFAAWSQNLGHENVSTTLTSYGKVPSHRQAKIIGDLRYRGFGGSDGELDPETIKRVLAHLSRNAA
jgi:integrase